jgi:uncharacterized protein YndB with AHSA1/START domain
LAALTEPDVLAKWLAPAEFDATPGGDVHFQWPSQGEMNGVVIVADRPRLFSYSWTESEGTSEIDFVIEALSDDARQLTLTHRGASMKDAPGFGAGWHGHLESLFEVLSRGTTSPEIRDARYEELRPEYEALLT